MNVKELVHLAKVVGHLYDDEQDDYECREPDPPDNHIFVSIEALSYFINRQTAAARKNEINPTELNHLRNVVGYLYDDEEKDFTEKDCPDNHIFVSVEALFDFIEELDEQAA